MMMMMMMMMTTTTIICQSGSDDLLPYLINTTKVRFVILKLGKYFV
jgi:hypothetical protein